MYSDTSEDSQLKGFQRLLHALEIRRYTFLISVVIDGAPRRTGWPFSRAAAVDKRLRQLHVSGKYTDRHFIVYVFLPNNGRQAMRLEFKDDTINVTFDDSPAGEIAAEHTSGLIADLQPTTGSA